MSIEGSEAPHRYGFWNGSISGKALNKSSIQLFVSIEDVGGGPTLYFHSYDEVFVTRKVTAKYVVGDQTVNAHADNDVMNQSPVMQ